MTAHTVQLPGSAQHRSFRLTPAREMRTEQLPDVVLRADEAREVLAVARAQDVSSGGCYSPGPSGIQLWSGPWNGLGGRVGSAQHLGSVDWSWDAPSEGFVTVFRVLLTAHGVQAGLTPQSLQDRVLGLARDEAAPARLPLPRLTTEALDTPVT